MSESQKEIKTKEEERENCPRCDVVDIFIDYTNLGCEPIEVIHQIAKGLATLVAIAPQEIRIVITERIKEDFHEMVEEGGAEIILHNTQEIMH